MNHGIETYNSNKLIAEFMGYQVVERPKVINGENFFEYLDKNGVYTYCESLLRYNDKWDWLMPVIAKIVEDYGEGWSFEEGYDLEVRYQSVVNFIKECNDER